MLALIDGDRYCRICEETKPLEQFYKDKKGKFGRGYFCKACANTKARIRHHQIKNTLEHKRQQKNAHCKRQFGINITEYEEKLAKQNFACAICGLKLSAHGQWTHLDHDHKTGKLRDFLCTNCNRGLGHFQDNKVLLAKAAQYLDTHNNSADVVKEVFVNDCSH